MNSLNPGVALHSPFERYRAGILSARRAVNVCLLALLICASVPAANADDFADWMQTLRAEARAAGISKATLDAALTDIELIPRVVELDRNQPEFKMTLDRYLGQFVSSTRQATAAQKLVEHAELLDAISKKYGVQKRYIVTFWGIETSFGKYLGSFNVPQALVTLAYDGRRSAYFRKELLNALRIIDGGHISADRMKGSWAGAMGQSQFMPSSFLAYAEDWDGDGKRDIWGTTADVFASTANYLAKAGWRDDMTWGREVRIPSDLVISSMGATKLSNSKTRLTLPAWQTAGVRNLDGSALPTRPLNARLVLPDGIGGRAFLVYSNFESILRWNRSNYYAIAVGSLSDTLR
jgi:membrane-bound lytic murein transglycosylase B